MSTRSHRGRRGRGQGQGRRQVISQIGGRHLPSVMWNQFIEFKNGSGEYVKLPDDYKIIFDSGNESKTLIGTEVVTQLGLPVRDICLTKLSGVGGDAICYRGAVLDLQLLDPYNSPHNVPNRPPLEHRVEP